uniref:SEA domain-containing protein n=1 Tax=Trichuris muris TaxID=70415 RepID=A0A5S6Q2Q0_TRIMR
MLMPWIVFAYALIQNSLINVGSAVEIVEPDGKEVGDRNDVRVDIKRYVYDKGILVDNYYARLRSVLSARLDYANIAYNTTFTLEASNCLGNRSVSLTRLEYLCSVAPT